MSLIFMDGFDYYSPQAGYRWNTMGNSMTTGRFGGYANVCNYGYQNLEQQFPLTTYTSLIVGAAIYTSYTSWSFVRFFSLTSDYHAHIDCSNNLIRLLDATGSVVATSTKTISVLNWHYIEVKITCNGTTGSVEVRVDGTTYINATNINTVRSGSNGYVEKVVFAGAYYDPIVYFDDLYICSTSGASNNTFLGDVRIQTLYPSAAGNTTQLTPSAGSNYQCVDETQWNGDTDYVSSSTAGQKDTYAFGDLSTTSASILAVQTVITARKDDAGTRSIAPVTRLSATDTDGTSSNLTANYAAYAAIQETKPAGGSWTVSDVNAAEFGVKVVS